jgi:redox-sensitive bicupin YhaK (pirin superfamily)
MRTHHPAQDRFHSQFGGWLDSWHSFSFGEHYDPARMGFRNLRVINDDRIAGGGGFPTHGHRDMEILTWVLEGAIAHQDSTGGKGEIRPGELQHMTAGRGIAHSEFNPSKTEKMRLLQIWIEPASKGLPAGYEQTDFPAADRAGKLQLVAASDGRNGAVRIAADAELYVTDLSTGQQVEHAVSAGRHAWIQVATGSIEVDGQRLAEGDGLAVSEATTLHLSGVDSSPAQVLLFDLG